jgi:hypothetical protein
VNVSNLMLELREPFPPAKISWRIARVVNEDGPTKGKAQVLAYIDARDVMERLDYICGIEGWQCRYSHTANKTVCDIGIKIDGEWLWKSDGAGDTDVEAEKGALSDAFKRAAVRWGIGRYLYDLGNNYAEVTRKENSKTWFITPDAQKTLEKLLPRGGTLKMDEARPLFSKLETDMLKINDAGMLRDWSVSVRDDVLKLPAAWQEDFIEKFSAHKATCARAA